MKNSKIEWTNNTWNFLRGCSRVSEGCRNCYAENIARRFSGPNLPYEGLITKGGKWNNTIKLLPEKLTDPWHWVQPKFIFVNSTSDLFHDDVPFELIAAAFWLMSVTTRHTYQILTKRPARMLAFFKWLGIDNQTGECDLWNSEDLIDKCAEKIPALANLKWQPVNQYRGGYDSCGPSFPYQNVWLGVSVEDQETADQRIPLLLQTPAAVRWISAEPLLGPIDLTRLNGCPTDYRYAYGECCDALNAKHPAKLDWVIVGGESGVNARPMDPGWALSLRDQCTAAGVPFFFKQWGNKRAGRALDGREWNQYPEIT